MAHAIALFRDAEPERAAQAFAAIVAAAPQSAEAARAHIYLGLISFDSLQVNEARKQLAAAIRLDPSVELPFGVSPKARILFEQVREQILEHRGLGPTAPAPVPGAPAPQVASEANAQVASAPGASVATGPGHSLLPSVLVTGVGVASLASAIVLGALAQTSANDIMPSTSAKDAASLAASSRDESRAADVLFAAAGAAALAGGILLVLELTSRGTGPQLSAGPIEGGVAVAATGRF